MQDASGGAINVDSARTAIAAVFRHSQYHRSLRRTLWQQVVDWLGDIIHAILSAIRSSPTLGWSVLAGIILLATLIISRTAYLRQARKAAPRMRTANAQETVGIDPWIVAQAEARGGRYLEAAHALYLAILESIAHSDRIVVDSAKTVGDYSRELRRIASDSLPLYREFARAYEPVVWGTRDCDRQRFDHLSAIAMRLAGRST